MFKISEIVPRAFPHSNVYSLDITRQTAVTVNGSTLLALLLKFLTPALLRSLAFYFINLDSSNNPTTFSKKLKYHFFFLTTCPEKLSQMIESPCCSKRFTLEFICFPQRT